MISDLERRLRYLEYRTPELAALRDLINRLDQEVRLARPGFSGGGCGSLCVVVLDEDDNPIPGADVEVRLDDAEGDVVATGTANSLGRFCISIAAPGTYWAEATHDDYAGPDSDTAEATCTSNEIHLVLTGGPEPCEYSRRFRIRTCTSGGPFSQGVTVTMTLGASSYSAVTDVDGYAIVELDTFGTYSYSASRVGMTTVTGTVVVLEPDCDYTTATTVERVMILTSGYVSADIDITELFSACPVPGALIEVHVAGNPAVAYSGYTNAAGRFHIPSVVHPESYQYFVTHPLFEDENGFMNAGGPFSGCAAGPASALKQLKWADDTKWPSFTCHNAPPSSLTVSIASTSPSGFVNTNYDFTGTYVVPLFNTIVGAVTGGVFSVEYRLCVDDGIGSPMAGRFSITLRAVTACGTPTVSIPTNGFVFSRILGTCAVPGAPSGSPVTATPTMSSSCPVIASWTSGSTTITITE